MRRGRPWVIGAVLLLSALGALQVLAGRLERRVTRRIEAEAARLGARAQVERVRVSLLPPLRLSGVRVEKPGLWDAQVDAVSVTFRPWGRKGWGATGHVSIGAATIALPAGLKLQLDPSEWEVDGEGSAELRVPVEGLTLTASSGANGRVLELRAKALPVGRLGRLFLAGAPAPDPGVVEGEVRGEDRAERGFEVLWRFEAMGAHTAGTAALTHGPGHSQVFLEAKLERLDFARLFAALGLERPAGAEDLGSLAAVVGAKGSLAEPASLVVTQRLDFSPPARLPRPSRASGTTSSTRRPCPTAPVGRSTSRPPRPTSSRGRTFRRSSWRRCSWVRTRPSSPTAGST